MDKEDCKARGIPWPLGECISGSGDFTPHPNEERFDFPCSAAWRDFYSEAPEPDRVVERNDPPEQRMEPPQPVKAPMPAPKPAPQPTRPTSRGTEL